MNKEYEKLILQFAQEGYKISEEQAKEIYKLQNEHQWSLLDLIAKVLLSYTILDSVLKLSTNDKNKIRKEFINKISSISKEQYKTEKSIMESIFEEAGKQKYYSTAYVMSIGINFELQKLTDEEIHKVVNGTIEGETWSDRLWCNKKSLEKTLKLEIESFLQGKTNVNKIQKVVKDRFNQNAFNTHRLVQTEVAKCQSAANDLFAEKHGIKQQMFCATLDFKTSEKCRRYDGKTFDVDDSNKPIPPLHPFCRSCLIDVPYENWNPTQRKNNITKEVINYKTYNEWYNENVKNNPEALTEEKKIKNRSGDKKQHEEYKGILGKEAPKSFDKFQDLKYNNVNEWNEIKVFVDSKINGRISQDATLKQWKDISKEVNDKIVGITTPNGIKISELSHHGIERFIGDGQKRIGVPVENVSEALLNPLEIKDVKTDTLGRKSQKFVGEKATVSINPETGNIIQTNPTSSKLAERLKRRIEDDKTK